MALLLLGAALRVSNLSITARSPDEKIYAAQARAALQDGMAGTRRVVDAFRRNPQLWIYPSPTRIGYAYLVAGAMSLTGTRDESAGTYVSCLASILTLAVTMRLGLRFLGGWITVLAILFLAVFPPELVVARRCWTDASSGLAATAMLYLTLEIWSDTKRWPLALLPVAGTAAVLIKETAVLVYAPCLLAALWSVLRRGRDARRASILLAGAVLWAAGAMTLLALSTGGPRVPFQIIVEQARLNATNPYALEYCTGPGYLLLLAFARLSPVTFVLALLGMAQAWARPGTRDRVAAALLAGFTVTSIAPYALVPHWLNLRYASASFAPLCLLASAALYQWFLLAKEKLSGGLFRWVAVGGAAAILIFAAADYRRFEQSYVRIPTPDLSVGMVADALNHETP